MSQPRYRDDLLRISHLFLKDWPELVDGRRSSIGQSQAIHAHHFCPLLEMQRPGDSATHPGKQKKTLSRIFASVILVALYMLYVNLTVLHL